MSLSKKEINRYSRHIQLNEVGVDGQEKLKQAKVLVIGAGGLGCPVLQYLAAAGIGTLGIVDFDVVEESNLQRQVLFNSSLTGKNKALAAKEQLKKLNPLIELIAYPEKLTFKNAVSLFKQYDLIIDGTDNFATRYLINDAALLCNKPYVFGAVHRFEGQVTVFNYRNGPTYRCLFPTPPKITSIPNCSEVGVLGVLPGIIGIYQANEVLKIFLEIGETLSGQLMIINTLKNSTSLIGIKRNKIEIETVLAQKSLSDQYALRAETDFKEITAVELKERLANGESFNFLDVRETHEQPKIEALKGVEIPLSSLKITDYNVLNKNNLVIYCQSGVRSKNVIKQLQQKGHSNLYNLTGGISAWLKQETKEDQLINERS